MTASSRLMIFIAAAAFIAIIFFGERGYRQRCAEMHPGEVLAQGSCVDHLTKGEK